ncbi:MAG: pyrimidine-nucleoside phosphorylase [Vulcanimicrobiaceae bacterium]
MTQADMRRAIARKRDGDALDATQWHDIVAAAGSGALDDAPLAALLMACVIRGMSDAETQALTEAFVASGETLVARDARTVDKHSSGGVGDTVSLIVVPLVAACGVPVAKLSGRALGHTGGTLDKLEALAGVRTDLAPERFFDIVAQVGCAIAAQSARLVPADKRFYALRDRTATVPSAGLIAASIVAKKIAGGAHGIVFDVKCGSGAFVRESADAFDLARKLVGLARGFGRRASAVVSDMEQPLGPAIGTGLELCEARDFLSGARRAPRLLALCERLAAAMLAVARPADAPNDDPERIARALAGGAAFDCFERMLAAQGATAGALIRLEPHGERCVVRAERSGFVAAIAPVTLGERARAIVEGHGPTAGIAVAVAAGDAVRAGEPLATVYGEPGAAADIRDCFTIADAPPVARPLIYGEIGAFSTLRGASA